MPFDLATSAAASLAGQTAYQDGLASEDAVCRDYLARGFELVEQRWRGRGGEIDLIFRGETEYVFVEVKKARTLEDAATRLSDRQLQRVARSAEDYLLNTLEAPFAAIRLDFAMVDQVGQIDVLENLSLF